MKSIKLATLAVTLVMACTVGLSAQANAATAVGERPARAVIKAKFCPNADQLNASIPIRKIEKLTGQYTGKVTGRVYVWSNDKTFCAVHVASGKWWGKERTRWVWLCDYPTKCSARYSSTNGKKWSKETRFTVPKDRCIRAAYGLGYNGLGQQFAAGYSIGEVCRRV